MDRTFVFILILGVMLMGGCVSSGPEYTGTNACSNVLLSTQVTGDTLSVYSNSFQFKEGYDIAIYGVGMCRSGNKPGENVNHRYDCGPWYLTVNKNSADGTIISRTCCKLTITEVASTNTRNSFGHIIYTVLGSTSTPVSKGPLGYSFCVTT